MFQSKYIEWLNGYKNKTHIHVAYERLISDLKTQTESEGMDKGIACKWKSKAGVAILRQNRL